MTILNVLITLLPIASYFALEGRKNMPSMHWPKMAPSLSLNYENDPSRMTGKWGGRRAQIVKLQDVVTLTVWLEKATYLRAECGPRALVTKRAGKGVPDPVAPLDPSFGGKLLARCSERAAGPTVFNALIQKRLSGLPRVDFVASDDHVIWTLPFLRKSGEAMEIFDALSVVADELDKFPRDGGTTRA